MRVIPVNEPLIKENEIEYVTETLRTGWISSSGRFIEAFEHGFAEYVGKRHGIAVNNGTNALTLALRALGIPEGSEVIIPSFTIISCALACIYNNLIPVFIDSEEDTWNMNCSKIEQEITPRTKAIMIVHIYGHPVDVEKVSQIAQKYNLHIIEDFAEAIGSEYKGRKCGSFGKISCVSFYANKTITTGEGGMCLTDSLKIAERLKGLRNLGFLPEKRFVHYELGFNFRITNLQAAIGCAQLERIEEHIAKKIWIGHAYTALLKGSEKKGLIRLPVERQWARNTYWMYGVVLNENLGKNVAQVMRNLSDNGIQTRPFFYPMHLQPVFKGFPWFQEKRLENCERLSERGFYLPSGLTLKEDDIQFIAESLDKVIQ